ncbi:YgfZ/GcvT domain-containing protein [Gloeothece verrucosa]|uniref:Folate-binding protein YgfZ n=1 Tax=Gloeothece verrucosa (strain PCC 7822) TaxID=497965 RepID=E0UBX9_GLOV7|nr:folate-binding protein YgfZ [Gloeothece verrucosa]ADN15194.1 folate-binding protein YgfZ [Gloeothece verrucosa PCC 7822]
MISALKAHQIKLGAVISADGTFASSFGNDGEAIKAAQTGVALSDRSHWGLIQLKGNERLRFLHNQTTNNINSLKPGQGCDTVFVNSTGRTLDLATAYVTDESIYLLVSPNRRQFLLQWMDRYIFPMDKVELEDSSGKYAIFTLIGPQSHSVLAKLNLDPLIGQPLNTHIQQKIDNSLVRVALGSGLALPGYTLMVPMQEALTVWEQLVNTGVTLLGNRVWEQLRILQGRPVPDYELTEDYNALESGLWKAISFEKGCYIGQETIARLNTYKGVKQRLWGVKLSQCVQPHTEVILEDKKVGILTSCTETQEGAFGLAYVKTKAGGEGLRVTLGEQTGELVSVPFLTHEYYQPQKTQTN